MDGPVTLHALAGLSQQVVDDNYSLQRSFLTYCTGLTLSVWNEINALMPLKCGNFIASQSACFLHA